MTIHHQNSRVTLHHGDALDVLRTLPDASVDAVVTDPPYGLGFMGKAWDSPDKNASTRPRADGDHTANPFKRARAEYGGASYGGNHAREMRAFGAWCAEWAAECLRVLKPGGHLLAFGGTRTWHRLACAVEDAGFEVRDSLAWLYGSGFPKSLDVSKAIDKAAGAEREGERSFTVEGGMGGGRAGWTMQRCDHCGRTRGSQAGNCQCPDTAPATPDAERWAGWGTALKPGHEPAVVARKPLQPWDILAGIGSQLDTLEQVWLALEVDPTTPTGAAGDSPAATDTSQSGSETTTSSSTVTSWRACWAELCDLTSTSTTATTSETTTALRTLSSSLSRLTAESTHPGATSPHGLTSLASAVDNLFASAVCGLRATLALSATEPATGSTPPSPLDAAEANGAAFEPVVVARKPLVGTVAANVLAHGTGALNIEACRIEHDEPAGKPSTGMHGRRAGIMGETIERHRETTSASTSGRWPANVILDEDMAGVLDEQSGTVGGSGGTFRDTDRRTYNAALTGTMNRPQTPTSYGKADGASRFFYVAKAPKRERPVVDGVAHPTVKPLALMRWLVRLVTPPGGTVLEPFAGSGTTVEACLLEGFQCIAIEKGDEYLPLILARINRQTNPLPEVAELVRRTNPEAAIVEQLRDVPLFELDGEGA